MGGDSYSIDETWNLAGTIYAVNLGGGTYYAPEWNWGTLFLVPEYGMSDDPYTYCYLYTSGRLFDVVAIPALPDDMTADADGRITCSIHASHIGTWNRFAEYKLATGYSWGGDGEATVYLEAGQQVILAASDDVGWLYVSSMDGTAGGWVEFSTSDEDYFEMINVNGAYANLDEVFGDVFYAG